MYILTQDKSAIINIDNVKIIAIEKHKQYIRADDIIIGTYKSEERLQEVFKEIMVRIAKGDKIEKVMYSSKALAGGNDYNMMPCCFEMPEE